MIQSSGDEDFSDPQRGRSRRGRRYGGRGDSAMEQSDLIVWGAGGLAASYSPVVQKVLGPTADYLGHVLKRITEKGAHNLSRIMHHAVQKLGERVDRDESVPPKVLKSVLLEGPFIEDQLSAEYFGGVMASSRSGIPRDDRGAALLHLLGGLSTYQIRSHCLFYGAFKELYDGSGKGVGESAERTSMKTFLPADGYRRALALAKDENYDAIAEHCVCGLARSDLIGEVYAGGSQAELKRNWSAAPGAGVVVMPSVLGVELLLWAHGRSDLSANQFLNPSLAFDFETGIEVPDGVCLAVF